MVRSLMRKNKKFEQQLSRVVNRTAINIHRKARQAAPVDEGLLRSSIKTRTEGNGLTGVVSVDVFYAPYIEFGTKSQVRVPPGLEDAAAQYRGNPGRGGRDTKVAIYEWARRKGIAQEAWYPIFLKIITQGIKPHPFLYPAAKSERPKYIKRVRTLVDKFSAA